MLKVEYKDLEEITKFLDNLVKKTKIKTALSTFVQRDKAEQLSKMIKDKYTEIKPDYDRTN